MGYDQKTTGVCNVCVWATDGKDGCRKQDFRDVLEMMIGMVELETMLWITGHFNAHIRETEPGEEENVGKYGWGKESRELWWSLRQKMI